MHSRSVYSRRAFLGGLIGVPALLAACASGGGAGELSRPRGRRDLIVRAELDEAPPGDLLLIVRRLRPQWLGRRGIGTPAVHVDGRYTGNVEVLTTIDVNDVAEIRFRSAADATTLYGTNYPAGVIEVSLRR